MSAATKITHEMRQEIMILEAEHTALIKEISTVLGSEDELITELQRWHDDFSNLVDNILVDSNLRAN
jgi:hypothetical protein